VLEKQKVENRKQKAEMSEVRGQRGKAESRKQKAEMPQVTIATLSTTLSL
jgi:hypothetical protein